MQKDIVQLRVHHLLCSILYEGNGYNEEFIKNMNACVYELKESKQILLLTTTDVICHNCPNKTKEQNCGLDGNGITDIDHYLLEALQLEVGTYDTKTLFKKIEQSITKEIFMTSCGKCNWFLKGYCSFESYHKKLQKWIAEG